jgi:hypothetical protein
MLSMLFAVSCKLVRASLVFLHAAALLDNIRNNSQLVQAAHVTTLLSCAVCCVGAASLA